MKKVFSWILTILYLVFFVLFVVFLVNFVTGKGNDYTMAIFMNSIFLSIIFGIWAHFLAKDTKGFPYYVTFPFYVLFCGFFILIGLIKSAMYGSAKYLAENNTSNDTPKCEEVYVVYNNGYERKLKLVESYCSDYGAPKGVEYGAKYNRFKDDIGYYWRSYDGNNTFISEDTLRSRGWRV